MQTISLFTLTYKKSNFVPSFVPPYVVAAGAIYFISVSVLVKFMVCKEVVRLAPFTSLVTQIKNELLVWFSLVDAFHKKESGYP